MQPLYKYYSEPYRIFFPFGIIYLLCGVMIWLPQIWSNENYPVLLHRFLVLNGFIASFIAGFLMTAVPKFSKTKSARPVEVSSFFILTLAGIIFAHLGKENVTFFVSAIQAAVILYFLLSRIFKRKENPPYTFIFIFVGLLLWLFSAVASVYLDSEIYKRIHYEGAIGAIILGVGGRLIPGILGHVEIVKYQRGIYEPPKSLLATVPIHFILFIFSYVGSYFISSPVGDFIKASVVLTIALFYWQLYRLPKIKSSLTYSLWTAGWLIVISFFMRALWIEGGIHATHVFFINGIVLLSLLVATRVLQSHGPQDKTLEDWNGLYFVTFIVVLSSVTRVSAYLVDDSYFHLLGLSALLLTTAVLIWGHKYLRFVVDFPNPDTYCKSK